MTDARAAFVAKLQARRVALGQRQADVAERLGVHATTVGKWESGLRWPYVEHAEQWAAVLGVRVVGGSLRGVFRPRPVAVCGTESGYTRHLRLGEERCLPCRAAWSRARAAAGMRNRRAQGVKGRGVL